MVSLMRTLPAGTLATLLLAPSIGCRRESAPPADTTTTAAPRMAPADLANLPARAPDYRLSYGGDSSQFGELRVPASQGPHPVVVLVHGGCFKAAYATTRDLAPMADALRDEGIASWNVEYRRVGQPGGGWPNTWRDVGSAIDHLRTLAPEYRLDLSRLVVVGHSAGGHLAMWAAARPRIPEGSPLRAPEPLAVRGAIDLAGPLDMTANIEGYQTLCRDTVITAMHGGTPETVAERYAQSSPIRLLPLGVRQVFVWPEHEEFVPRPLVDAYIQAAQQAGDSVRLFVIPGAGHFDIASPTTSTWPVLLAAIRSLLEGKLPPP